MICVKINNLKDFTSKLFVKDVFDEMYLTGATIRTHSTFQIEGRTNPDFFPDSDSLGLEEYNSWKMLRPICFEIIKGKQLPCFFKIVLKLSPAQVQRFLQQLPENVLSIKPADIAGLFVNIKYELGIITLTTGTSLTVFTLDKEPEKQFDQSICQFLTNHDIDFSIE